MKKIVIFNPKGGVGKTTLSTNLASYYASQKKQTALMDYDPQGSCSYWLNKRSPSRPAIQGISAFKKTAGMTKSFILRLDQGTERVIVDSPAGADINEFKDVLNEADAILVPVLPSDIDIHAVTNAIADLLVRAKIQNRDKRIAVIANRSRANTLIYKRLEKFLNSLEIPFIATLRDTQNYIRAAEEGVGIFEMDEKKVTKDLLSWQPILDWVERRHSEMEKTVSHLSEYRAWLNRH